MRNNKMAFVLATAMGFGGMQVATAADMPVKARPMEPLPVAYNWTGCYIGLQGGIKSARVRDNYGANTLAVVPGTEASDRIHFSGGEFGPTVGCNYQQSNWVFGVEADWSWSNGTGEAVETLFPTFRVSANERWVGTLRGRLGYTFAPNWLLYVTGGGAATSIKFANYVPGSAVAYVDQTQTLTGWVVGAGTEYALNNHWSIKGEALYLDYGSKSYFTATTPVALAVFDVKLNEWIGRVGVNYKF
jgi:outer membrane immunogenic protein